MDAKVTLSFDATVIERAKAYAGQNGISLSRLTELLLRKATSGGYRSIEEMPVSEWVSMVSEGESEYITSKGKKDLREEYYSKKRK